MYMRRCQEAHQIRVWILVFYRTFESELYFSISDFRVWIPGDFSVAWNLDSFNVHDGCFQEISVTVVPSSQIKLHVSTTLSTSLQQFKRDTHWWLLASGPIPFLFSNDMMHCNDMFSWLLKYIGVKFFYHTTIHETFLCTPPCEGKKYPKNNSMIFDGFFFNYDSPFFPQHR